MWKLRVEFGTKGSERLIRVETNDITAGWLTCCTIQKERNITYDTRTRPPELTSLYYSPTPQYGTQNHKEPVGL